MQLLGLLTLLALGFFLFQAALTVHAYVTLTRPPRRSYAFAVSRGIPAEPADLHPTPEHTEWQLHSLALRMPVWDIKGTPPNGPILIICHGWSSSRIIELARVADMIPHVSRILLWDMPGHGEADGVSSLGARDAEHLRNLIRDARTDDETPIVLCGFSLGAGVCLEAANEPAVRAVICEAPYLAPITPARNALRMMGLPASVSARIASLVIGLRNGQGLSWLADGGRFNRQRVASHTKVPVLVIHGDADPISPISDGQAIANAAPDGRCHVIAGAGHTDLWARHRREVADVEADFIEHAIADAVSPESSPAGRP